MNNEIKNKKDLQYLIKRSPDEEVTANGNTVSLFCNDSEEINSYRGWVTYNNDVFLPGFPKPIEIDETHNDLDVNDFSIYDSHEGTIIRIFFIENKWYVSTNRKLDAMKSKWSSKYTTFGQSFTNAIRYIMDDLDEDEDDELDMTFSEKLNITSCKNNEYLNKIFQAHLDPTKKYIFILKPSQEERIVCRVEPVPTIYHIGTFDKDNNFDLDSHISLNDTIIEKPKKHVFSSFQEMTCAVENINIDHYQGLILICKKTNQHYKFLNHRYKYLFDIRGNVSSLKFRYIQLRNGDRKILNDFIALYNFGKECNNIERDLQRLSIILNEKYKNTFILKTEPISNKTKEDLFIKIINTFYRKTRQRIDQTIVKNLINGEEPSLVNQMLNNMRKEEQKI